MSKIFVVHLGSNKCEDNNNSISQLNSFHNSLLMSIVDAHENDLSKVDRKIDKRKIHIYSINSSSTVFSCSIRAMYNIVHSNQNKRLMLK